jgi:hypothetical protein
MVFLAQVTVNRHLLLIQTKYYSDEKLCLTQFDIYEMLKYLVFFIKWQGLQS